MDSIAVLILTFSAIVGWSVFMLVHKIGKSNELPEYSTFFYATILSVLTASIVAVVALLILVNGA